ncbi:MAG: serine/threonine-protein kinase [Candidatus Obscuribacterales bacterium]|jgi:serine/threonine-protein kinase
MTDLCKKCGKPPLAEKAGSFTSYLFVHNYCQCQEKHEPSTVPQFNRPQDEREAKLDVCGHCGKAIGAQERSGSFTSFLFKDLRCQCKVPLIAKPLASKTTTRQRTNTSYRSTHKSKFQDPGSSDEPGSQQTASRKTALQIGTIIGGTFKIKSIIGSGGMGVVYAAEHIGLRRNFALKILSPELVNEQTWKRFQAEAKTLGALHHATLVNVYDLGIHDHSLPYYSMDLLVGRTLEQILIDDGPLYLDEAIEIFLQVLDGLAYAHRNDIIHRDLKPGNIMICDTDGGYEVKILDFGISKFLQLGRQNQSLTMVGETFGSPFYMSPEQSGGASVDARSDIYSIGCSLFEALTAYVPFDGSSQMEIVMMHEQDEPPLLAEVDPETKFPDSIEYVVAKCLEKHPDDRYQSAKELAIDLERIKENKYARSFFEGKKPFKSLNQRRSENSEDKGTTGNSKRAMIVFTILLVLATLTVAATIYAYSQPIIASLPFTKKKEGKALTEQQTYYSKLSDDGTTLQFSFPESEIGLINSSRKFIGALPACGLVQFPVHKRLYFFTNAYSAEHPEVLKHFRQDDLYTFVARYKFADSNKLRDTLINLKPLTGLKQLELAECDFGDEEVVYANELSNLTSLDLKTTNLTPIGLKNFDLLKRLKYINYDLNKHITALLETIAGNTQLESLQISTPDKPITSADLKLLLTLTQLVQLNIENTGATDDMFLQLVELPNIKVINVRGCKISKAALKTVSQKFGKSIEVLVDPVEITKSIHKASDHAMPEFYEAK